MAETGSRSCRHRTRIYPDNHCVAAALPAGRGTALLCFMRRAILVAAGPVTDARPLLGDQHQMVGAVHHRGIVGVTRFQRVKFASSTESSAAVSEFQRRSGAKRPWKRSSPHTSSMAKARPKHSRSSWAENRCEFNSRLVPSASRRCCGPWACGVVEIAGLFETAHEDRRRGADGTHSGDEMPTGHPRKLAAIWALGGGRGRWQSTL